MTQNQIAFQVHKETKRNNMVVAAETKRHNQAMEAETYRANVAKETETNRHNVVSESLGFSTLEETTRHNLATESYNLQWLSETQRSNLANEAIRSYSAETERMNHYVRQQEADIKQFQAEIQEQQLFLAQDSFDFTKLMTQQQLSETQRHNKQQEKLQAEKNLADYDASIYATDVASDDRRWQADLDYQLRQSKLKLDVFSAIAEANRDNARAFRDTVGASSELFSFVVDDGLSLLD